MLWGPPVLFPTALLGIGARSSQTRRPANVRRPLFLLPARDRRSEFWGSRSVPRHLRLPSQARRALSRSACSPSSSTGRFGTPIGARVSSSGLGTPFGICAYVRDDSSGSDGVVNPARLLLPSFFLTLAPNEFPLSVFFFDRAVSGRLSSASPPVSPFYFFSPIRRLFAVDSAGP